MGQHHDQDAGGPAVSVRVLALQPRRAGAAFFLCMASAAAAAQALPARYGDWTASAGVQHRRLVERADNGARLVTESGAMLALRLQRELPLARGGALQARVGIAAGRLDYDGQTQGGVPLASDTGHRDLEAGLAWRPWPVAGWGEAWVSLDVLQQRRQIASTATARGLRETSTLLLPGLRWVASFEAAGWQWRPAARLRASAHHRLRIAYGGAFDDSDLRGGQRWESQLALGLSRPGSPWQWELAWTHARQAASAWQPITRGGVPAGNVRQPRIEIDDLALAVRRDF